MHFVSCCTFFMLWLKSHALHKLKVLVLTTISITYYPGCFSLDLQLIECLLALPVLAHVTSGHHTLAG